MKGLRGKYLAVWWGRDFQALNETPGRAEKRRGTNFWMPFTLLVMRTTDRLWPQNDPQWLQ